MEAININELDKKTKKKPTATVEQVVVIPNFIVWIVLGLLLTNAITGGVLYMNRGLLVDSWKAQVHAMTEPNKVEAKEQTKDNGGANLQSGAEIVTSPKPTATPTITNDTKGGCDLRFNELHEGVCYPLAQ